MTVSTSDVKTYYPATRNDTSSNGGRMTANACATGGTETVWPHASASELTAGSNKYRKLFHKIENSDNSAFPNFRVFLAGPTPGDDHLFIFEGTQTDTQDDLTGSEDLYGAGTLDTNVSASATEIIVTVEDWSNYPIFRDGDLIAISDGYYSSGVWQTETKLEFATISGAPSPSGNDITLTLAAGLANAYTAGQCSIASVVEVGDLDASVGTLVVTSSAGTCSGASITPSNKGAVEQSVTLTFTSATAFDAVGDTLGSLGSGNVSSNFAPTNSDFGVPYFTIASAAWGGTFQAGDTVVIPLHPAAAGIWERRVIPAGASSVASFARQIYLYGESA